MPISVRWCVNNFMRHRPDETMLRWKELGVHVEISGCLGMCRQCRNEVACVIHEEMADSLSMADELVHRCVSG